MITPAPRTLSIAPSPPASVGSTVVRRAKRKSAPEDPAADQSILAAFRGGASVAQIARLTGRPQGAVTWVLKKAGLKPNDRRRPGVDERGDAAPDDPERSCPVQDAAFQQAMRRAIAAGAEMPPMIGVFRDPGPLNVRRLFEPVPRGSGCTSPASECADLHKAQD
jgi:hypothetical protein